MKTSRASYQTWLKWSSVLMIMTLFWLTVSLPVVNQARAKAIEYMTEKAGQEDSSGNPFAGTTEEKTETGNSVLSEYLHDIPVFSLSHTAVVKIGKCHADDPYFAYHPEMICPPPEC